METLLCKEKTKTRQRFYVAIDHGLSFPQMKGLERPFDILNEISQNKEIDGLIASLGIYRQAQKLQIDLSQKERLVVTDFASVTEQDGRQILTHREMIVKPEETALVEPNCFKMFLNMYDDPADLYRNCRDLERFTVYGAQHGVKSLAEIMFYGNRAFENPQTKAEELIRGCRIAMELGADVLKIPFFDDTELIDTIADTLKLPIYLLGGSKEDNYEDFLCQLRKMAQCKIDGMMFGRNIWQSEDMSRTIDDILCILNNYSEE